MVFTVTSCLKSSAIKKLTVSLVCMDQCPPALSSSCVLMHDWNTESLTLLFDFQSTGLKLCLTAPLLLGLLSVLGCSRGPLQFSHRKIKKSIHHHTFYPHIRGGCRNVLQGCPGVTGVNEARHHSGDALNRADRYHGIKGWAFPSI